MPLNILWKKLLNKSYQREKMNVYINSSDFTIERINNYNKMRKSKINNQLFNKEKNFHQKLIKLPQKVTMKNNLIQ